MSKIGIFSHVRMPVDGRGICVHAIRAKEMADALTRRGHDVQLFHPPVRQDANRTTHRPRLSAEEWRQAVIEKDVVVLSTNLAQRAYRNGVPERRCPIVVDMFDPSLVGIIPSLAAGEFADIELERFRLRTQGACQIGDYFICASAEQRLWTLGLLSAWGRINTHTFSSDMIAVVPTGVPAISPSFEPGLFKGRVIPPDSRVILWPGGVFAWYCPVPVLNAMTHVLARCPDARLLFVGASNEAFEPGAKMRDLHALADRLNHSTKRVFFEPAVPYAERGRIYADADVAISLFRQGLENELSFRTRLVDILWGGCPVVTTTGSSLTALIHATNSGISLDCHSPETVAGALCQILENPVLRARMSANGQRCANDNFAWDKVVTPLHEFCSEPRPAPDRNMFPARQFLSRTTRLRRQLRDTLLRCRRRLRRARSQSSLF